MPSLVQIMAWHLFGAKPLSEPMLAYCQLNPSMNKLQCHLIESQTFSFKKMHLKMLCAKWQSSCLSLYVLTLQVLRWEHSRTRSILWLLTLWILSSPGHFCEITVASLNQQNCREREHLLTWWIRGTLTHQGHNTVHHLVDKGYMKLL